MSVSISWFTSGRSRSLFASIGTTVGTPYTRSQLSKKLRSLRKKFRIMSGRIARSQDPSHLTPHDRDLLYLWSRFSPASQASLKSLLLTSIQHEDTKSIAKKLCALSPSSLLPRRHPSLDTSEDEPEEVLLRRFRRAVMKVGAAHSLACYGDRPLFCCRNSEAIDPDHQEIASVLDSCSADVLLRLFPNGLTSIKLLWLHLCSGLPHHGCSPCLFLVSRSCWLPLWHVNSIPSLHHYSSSFLRPAKNLRARYSSWVIITGSTDGINKAFAF